MDDLRKAERFRVAQEQALARFRANPANPPMIVDPDNSFDSYGFRAKLTTPPHSNSSSHPSNPNAFPLQPPSLPQDSSSLFA